MGLSPALRQKIITFQRVELTAYHIYRKLAQMTRSPDNRRILETIAEDELHHYQEWKRYTGQEVKPDRVAIWKSTLAGQVLGLTFTLKLLERAEAKAQVNYTALQPDSSNWGSTTAGRPSGAPRISISSSLP